MLPGQVAKQSRLLHLAVAAWLKLKLKLTRCLVNNDRQQDVER